MAPKRSLKSRIDRLGLILAGAGQTVGGDSCQLGRSDSDFFAGSGNPAIPVLVALSEKRFQALVRGGLELRGYIVWVVPNMRLTTAGLPDLLAWHPRVPGLLLAYELKRERDYEVSQKQQAAIAHLATVPGIDARIVRPSNWDAIRNALDAPDPIGELEKLREVVET